MLLALAASLAIVSQDQVSLRAAPRESAATQAVMWQGDALEIRGERLGYLQVYDHRRERGGFIKASELRLLSLQPADAPGLLSVVRFLRDSPGSEAMGISYAAAYLKAAPAKDIGPEAFDAIGRIAERLARRASRHNKSEDTVIAAHLEVVASYGIVMRSVEQNGQLNICYDGEAYRHVMAISTDSSEQARAALALTREDCIDPHLRPLDRYALDQWRADILARVDTSTLPEFEKNRLRLRQAAVWSGLAFQRARRGEDAGVAAESALQALAGVNTRELAESDGNAYNEAAVRVGASRWADGRAVVKKNPGLALSFSAGQPGETCIELKDSRQKDSPVLFRRCTYGLVWPASVSLHPQGIAVTLAVQPLDSWRELWVFHKTAEHWVLDVIPPALSDPGVGYVEWAGWIPGSAQMLTAREARVAGRYQRKFEIVSLDSMEVKKQADNPSALSQFYRWQDPSWKSQTVSIR